MSTRELNRIKKLITDEFEFIRTKNNSGIDLWEDLLDLREDVIIREINESVGNRKLTDDESYLIYKFWHEQFERNISLTVRERQ